MDWRSEIAPLLTRDADGAPRIRARTIEEILAEKDEGRMFCSSVQGRRWEGKEVQGLRQGRWLFFEGDNLRFEVIYVNDRISWICGYDASGGVDPAAVFEGEWASARSPFRKERELMLIVLHGLRTVDDMPNVMHRLGIAGAGAIASIRALRESLGISLVTARQIVMELLPSG